MNTRIHQAIVVLILVSLAVLVFGLRFAFDSTDLRRMVREAHRNEELEQSRRSTLRRFDAREETVRGLIAQRCRLSQALAHFQELDDEGSDHLKRLSRTHGRNCSDAEENYQHILALIKNFLRDRHEEAAVVLCRLEKDYQQLRADQNMPSATPTKRTERSP